MLQLAGNGTKLFEQNVRLFQDLFDFHEEIRCAVHWELHRSVSQ
jgi:hypothetical protein